MESRALQGCRHWCKCHPGLSLPPFSYIPPVALICKSSVKLLLLQAMARPAGINAQQCRADQRKGKDLGVNGSEIDTSAQTSYKQAREYNLFARRGILMLMRHKNTN